LPVAPLEEVDLPELFPFGMLIIGSGGSGKEWLTKWTTGVEVFVLDEQVQQLVHGFSHFKSRKFTNLLIHCSLIVIALSLFEGENALPSGVNFC
jgi:hypothetical protein